jgi:hypothetical protein
VSQNQDKLLTPDPGAHIAASGVPFQDFPKFLEYRVAGIMPVPVIYTFEAIQVGHGDPQGKIVSGGRMQLSRHPSINRSTIGHAGKCIGGCQLLQETVLLFDLSVKVHNPAADTDTGQQFLSMKGLGQVVVGSSSQAAHDLVDICHCGQYSV